MSNEISETLFRKKRHWYLIAGVLLEILCGTAYAFSVFHAPLIEKFHCEFSDVSFIFTAGNLVSMVFSLALAAKVRRRLNVRKEVILGCTLYALGYLLSAFVSSSIYILYIPLVLLHNIGCVMVYPVLVSYAVELYPDRPGMASGLMTAGYGSGAILWAPVCTKLMERTGSVSSTFFLLGGGLLLLMLLLSLVLRDIPPNFSKQFAETQNTTNASASLDRYYSVNRKQMVRLPALYLLLAGFMLTMAGGSAVVSQCAYMLTQFYGVSASTAALAVSAVAVANVLGRLCCGAVSDKLGKTNTVFGAQIIACAALLTLSTVRTGGLFTGLAMVLIFAFGGISCLIAPTTGEVFGHRYVGENYTVTYSVFALAALAGPTLSSSIIESTGSCAKAVLTCGCMAIVGIALMTAVLLILKRQHKTVCIHHEKD